METKWESPCGRVVLYCGDCRDFLPALGKDDAVVTDPPYGIAHKSHGSAFKGSTPIAGDESIDIAVDVLRSTADAQQVSFYSPFQSLPIKWRSILVWDKGDHVGIGGDRRTCWKRDFELIGIRNNKPLNGQRDSAVLHFPALLPPPSGHFCEKPLGLMGYLIGKINAELIADPFMGSGTTGVAAVRLGRRFWGAEHDEHHFATARARIMDALGMEVSFNGVRQRKMFLA